ncbi:hypothetical protein BCL79_0639 [Stenotrophomonas rhizophila]|uniref:Uncharacterized protein n=1 Tax=Stenotrophomonas rhizophila TaxID=216778 RepID=A0A498CEN1_9GAMM|nr:hypothetical protein [Stenotrophomonas rhizophila]RLK56256.1 hypothetical protein BCL79_0639 [Stenotrophomonas rhizophila]
MSKASAIRLLHAERCSVDEIAAAVHMARRNVAWFIRTWIGDERDSEIKRERAA